jgi:hypothetical protein
VNGQRADQPSVLPHQRQPVAHARQHRTAVARCLAVAIAQAEHREQRGAIQQHAEHEGAADADGGEQDAAHGGAQHAAGVVGADVDRHRHAHLLAADHLADHDAAHRVVGGPANAVDEAGQRELPDREVPGIGQHRQRGGTAAHQRDHADLRGAPLDPFRHRAKHRAEQPHRQQAQHGHHGNEEGRASGAVDEHRDGQGFQPADDEHDQPGVPQAPEVAVGEQQGLARRRRVRRADLAHGLDVPQVSACVVSACGRTLRRVWALRRQGATLAWFRCRVIRGYLLCPDWLSAPDAQADPPERLRHELRGAPVARVVDASARPRR